MTEEYFDVDSFVTKYEYFEQGIEEYSVDEINNLTEGVDNE